MYRYFLFHYYDYYPSGGMHDCALKANNIDEFIAYINNNVDLFSNFHYYDATEDKVMYAKMEKYEDKDYFMRQRFLEWSEKRNG